MSQFLNLGRLECSITYRCFSRCKHCQVGPEQRALHAAALTPGLAERLARRVPSAAQDEF